jgi:uncharacterized delta-60 repeat protein
MKVLLSFIAFLFLFTYALGQAGANDPSFNTFDDNRFGIGGGANGTPVWCSAIQPDQKIVIGGNFTAYNGVSRVRIARLNTDGSLDTTFNPGTGFDFTVSAVSVQADGKIIVGGDFLTFNGVPAKRMARLNTDGSLDPSFNTGNIFDDNVGVTLIQPDGKILVGGMFTFSYPGGLGGDGITRLNSDGTPDQNFHTGLGSNQEEVIALALQPDGKIVVGGKFNDFDGVSRNGIVRLNSNGSLDMGFSVGTGFDYWVYTLSVQADGKIIAGGNFTNYNGVAEKYITRLNTNGSLDTTFDTGSGLFNGHVWATAIQPDGQIIVAGTISVFNGVATNRILRLNPDGSRDLTFTSEIGINLTNAVYSLDLQSDGKIIPSGGFSFAYEGAGKSGITRMNTDGTIDTGFNPVPGFNNWVYATALQPDQKIIAGGRFKAFNGKERQRIARLNTDGSIDLSFDPGPGFAGDVLAVAVQPDGKIIAGGNFETFNGITRRYIARLNADGTLDATFNPPGSGLSDLVNCIIIQPDGKILIGGEFTNLNGVARGRVARLNTNGTLDPTFNPGLGFNQYGDAVYTLSVQADGKVIVGGDFTTFISTTVNRIARLNANGTLDASFVSGTGFNVNTEVEATAVQPDGKIIVGGTFSSYNGSAISRSITRLNTDGSIDNTFTPGTGFSANAIVWSLALQPDGKIIAGGGFSTYNGVARSCIARLNTDGTLDTLFQVGTGHGATVRSVTIQPDGKILSAGDFTAYNGARRNRIARVLITCPTISPAAVTANVSCSGASDGVIDLTPSGGTFPYSVDWNDGIHTEDRTGLNGGTYSAVITDANGCSTTFNTIINEPVSSITATTDITNVSCFNGADGEIDITPSGGVLPYTFDWGGTAAEDRTGLTAGTYTVAISDVNGCTLVHAQVNQPTSPLSGTALLTNVSCFGDSNGAIDLTPAGGTMPYTVEWNTGELLEDRTGLTAGTYVADVLDDNGCSITVSYLLTQPSPIVSSFSVSNCNAYTWNTQTYTASGAYTHVYTAANGCDSTVTLNLTINPATTSSMAHTACNSFTLNGQTYTSSGTYTQNLVSTAGCDSTLTLNLTINHTTASSVAHTACNSFTLNGQTYTSSGTYLQHLANAVGCDSVLTLNLVVLNPTTSLITQTACGSFTLNGQTYASSGVYTQNLVNVAGCDSTLTLDLAIHDLPLVSAVDNGNGFLTASGAAFYQWMDCATGTAIAGAVSQNFTVLVDGTYAVIGTSNDGCEDTSACVVINYLGLKEQGIPGIYLAPNPTMDIIVIQFEGENAKLVIRDSQGKIMGAESIVPGDQISMKSYANGVYIFEIETAKGRGISKVVKD